jgi:hypothetical protein
MKSSQEKSGKKKKLLNPSMSKLPIPQNFGQGDVFITTPGREYYEPSHTPDLVPTAIIFNDLFKCIPSVIHVRKTFTEELINFLRKNGKVISEVTTIPNKKSGTTIYDPYDIDFFEEDNSDYKGGFLYKESIIRFDCESSRKRSKKQDKKPKLYTIDIYFKPGTVPPLSDFETFLFEEQLENTIYAIFRDDHGGVRFEPFETEVPEGFSVDDYYPENFKHFHDRMIESLKLNEAGLYLLHGEPGTGKTTYIKYLASQTDRDLIYLPVALIEALSDPSFLPILLKKKHSILVIEDAEKALLARDGGSSSSLVSSILNLTDGIMGNVFNISIIATYNSPRQDIDKALLRKGRIKGEYKFDKLPIEHCQKILDANKIKYKATEPMTLAEIFNTDSDDVILSKELVQEKRMGFC